MYLPRLTARFTCCTRFPGCGLSLRSVFFTLPLDEDRPCPFFDVDDDLPRPFFFDREEDELLLRPDEEDRLRPPFFDDEEERLRPLPFFCDLPEEEDDDRLRPLDELRPPFFDGMREREAFFGERPDEEDRLPPPFFPELRDDEEERLRLLPFVGDLLEERLLPLEELRPPLPDEEDERLRPPFFDRLRERELPEEEDRLRTTFFCDLPEEEEEDDRLREREDFFGERPDEEERLRPLEELRPTFFADLLRPLEELRLPFFERLREREVFFGPPFFDELLERLRLGDSDFFLLREGLVFSAEDFLLREDCRFFGEALRERDRLLAFFDFERPTGDLLLERDLFGEELRDGLLRFFDGDLLFPFLFFLPMLDELFLASIGIINSRCKFN